MYIQYNDIKNELQKETRKFRQLLETARVDRVEFKNTYRGAHHVKKESVDGNGKHS